MALCIWYAYCVSLINSRLNEPGPQNYLSPPSRFNLSAKTCWPFYKGKRQSPRFSAIIPEEMRRQISKSWLALVYLMFDISATFLGVFQHIRVSLASWYSVFLSLCLPLYFTWHLCLRLCLCLAFMITWRLRLCLAFMFTQAREIPCIRPVGAAHARDEERVDRGA